MDTHSGRIGRTYNSPELSESNLVKTEWIIRLSVWSILTAWVRVCLKADAAVLCVLGDHKLVPENMLLTCRLLLFSCPPWSVSTCGQYTSMNARNSCNVILSTDICISILSQPCVAVECITHVWLPWTHAPHGKYQRIPKNLLAL